jgi:4'-phosphopantetheinyl transferase
MHSVLAGGVHVVVARLDAGAQAQADLAACLAPHERLRAQRYVAERDRRRFIVARARLRELLGERVGVPAEAVDIVAGRNGKPALGPRCAGSGVCFNLARCEDLAIYAFAGREVGIDLEKVRELPEADAIAERICAPAELGCYRALAAPEKLAGFFALWTRKEALAKARGEGLSRDLREIDASAVRNFHPVPGFIAAACLE